MFFPSAAVTYSKLQQMRQNQKEKPCFSFLLCRVQKNFSKVTTNEWKNNQALIVFPECEESK